MVRTSVQCANAKVGNVYVYDRESQEFFALKPRVARRKPITRTSGGTCSLMLATTLGNEANCSPVSRNCSEHICRTADTPACGNTSSTILQKQLGTLDVLPLSVRAAR